MTRLLIGAVVLSLVAMVVLAVAVAYGKSRYRRWAGPAQALCPHYRIERQGMNAIFIPGIPITEGDYIAACQHCGVMIAKADMLTLRQQFESDPHGSLDVLDGRLRPFEKAARRANRWHWATEIVSPFDKNDQFA